MSGLRLGTRGSALAIAQSGQIAEALRARGHRVDLIRIDTPGDGTTTPLAGRAHEGIFTSSLQQALEAGEIDLAVHSMKDLPTFGSGATHIAAVPRRADPRDALVSDRTLAELPLGAVVGTCSVRRSAWVHRARPDLQVLPIRGNIDDRITQQRLGRFDAIVLAVAGLVRLGRARDIREVIAAGALIPAPAQGALALEVCTGDARTIDAVAAIDHRATRLAVELERAILSNIDPTDATAIGVLVHAVHGGYRVSADIAQPDGSGRLVVHRTLAGSPLHDPAVRRAVAAEVSAELFAAGMTVAA